jgi:ABC-type glutathione transport system ATPase component
VKALHLPGCLARPSIKGVFVFASLQDVETERGVTEALEAAGEGVTSLVIAHRLSTVRRADWIVVVAGGTVVEQGTHEQLLQLRGVYHGLVSSAASKGQEHWGLPATRTLPADEPAHTTKEFAAAA